MKAKISRINLIEAMSKAAKAVGKSPLPVRNNMLYIEARKSPDQIIIIGANADMAIRTATEDSEDTSVEEEGSVVIGIKTIEIIKNSDFFHVYIESKKGSGEAVISFLDMNGEAKYHLACIDGKHFPHVSFQMKDTFSVSGDALKEAWTNASVCMSTKLTMPVLTGIHMTSKNGKLHVESTDSYRMCMMTLEKPVAASDFDVILPGASVKRILPFLSEKDVTVSICRNAAVIETDNMTIRMQLLEGTYPNFAKVVGKETVLQLTAESEKLTDLLKRLSFLFADEPKILFDSESKSFSARGEYGKATESLECKTEGKPIRICFDAEYMLDALNMFEGSHVTVSFSGKMSPFAAEETHADIKIRCVMLPIRYI